MFDTVEQKMQWACSMWANYIETGNMALSRNDATERQQSHIIRKLSADQEAMVAELRSIKQGIINGDIQITDKRK